MQREQASGNERAPTVCSVVYYGAPAALPPMLHEALSLAERGVSVEAICLASGPGDPPAEAHGPRFRTTRVRVRARGLLRSLFPRAAGNRVLSALQYGASYVEYVARVVVRALRSRADLYVANDLPTLLPTLLAARLRRKPLVYRAHELYAEAHPQTPFAGFWRFLDRLLVPRCDAVVTPEENRSVIYREEFGAREAPLTVRNCPPYREPLSSRRLRDEVRERGVAFSTIVLYQGLVDSMRCIEEIAEAARHFDEGVVLVILGGGYGKWADPAAALADRERVVVLPRVPYEEVPPLTASADVGVLLYRNNCRNNYLCAPNKVFEYMMMGVPVIASRFPGMVSLVEQQGVGLCVDPERPEEIAAAVNRLARDPELRARMRAEALRLTRERYNWEQEFPRLWARYRQLLAGEAG